MNSEYTQERIDATKAQITAYENAVLAISTGGVEEYRLDTGQTRTWVRKQDLQKLQDALDMLYNRLATLEARLTGAGTITVRPAW